MAGPLSSLRRGCRRVAVSAKPPGGRSRRKTAVMEPERRTSPASRVAQPIAPLGVPPGYANLMAPILPEDFSWEAFVEASLKDDSRPCIRVNPLKTSLAGVRRYSVLHRWRIVEPVPWCNALPDTLGSGYWLDTSTAPPPSPMPGRWSDVLDPDDARLEDEGVANLKWEMDAAHYAGHVYVQNASSLLPVAALADAFEGGKAPQGACVLDAAAAPGATTTALASWVAPGRGVVVANEVQTLHAKTLIANLLRLGAMPHVAVTKVDARHLDRYWPEAFDAVLLDAPCSGKSTESWMKLKDSEAVEHWEAMKQVGGLSRTQRQMAESCFQALKPGGVLVYSTCTLNPVENEDVIAHLEAKFGDAIERLSLESLPGIGDMVTPDGFVRCWPQKSDASGCFVARVRKTRSVCGDTRSVQSQWSIPYFEPVTKNEVRLLERYFRSTYDQWPPDELDSSFLRNGKDIWLCPKAFRPFRAAGLKRCGVLLANCQDKGLPYAASYEWSLSFAHRLPEGAPGVATLNPEAAQAFCAGEDVQPAWDETVALARDGDQAVARCGDYIVGTGRWLGDVLRNDTPREWRSSGVVL